MPNNQVGHQLYVSAPPVFTGYTVRGGTWTEKDATKFEDLLNGNEETFNTTFWDPGIDAKCDLLLDSVSTLNVGDVLTESGGAARSWLVKSLERKNFGKRSLIYSVDLQFRSAQDLSSVS